MTHQEPRFTPRQRVAGVPQVEIMHAAAGGQLVITAHVDVPADYVAPSTLKDDIGEALYILAHGGEAQRLAAGTDATNERPAPYGYGLFLQSQPLAEFLGSTAAAEEVK